MMADNSKNNLANPDLWIRLIYMVLFWLLTLVARFAIAVIAVIQFLLVLMAGEANRNLRQLGYGIARWTEQSYAFLSFASDQKPYPFQDWPTPPSDGER